MNKKRHKSKLTAVIVIAVLAESSVQGSPYGHVHSEES